MRHIFVLLCFFLALTTFVWLKSLDNEKINIKIGETSVRVDVVDTPEERNRGLSGKNVLEDGEGMLFVFENPGIYGFWMKDMNFAIDIIWIGEDKKVLGVERGVSPSSFPTVFYPPSEILYALEVPATFSDTTNIKVGQSMLVGE